MNSAGNVIAMIKSKVHNDRELYVTVPSDMADTVEAVLNLKGHRVKRGPLVEGRAPLAVGWVSKANVQEALVLIAATTDVSVIGYQDYSGVVRCENFSGSTERAVRELIEKGYAMRREAQLDLNT